MSAPLIPDALWDLVEPLLPRSHTTTEGWTAARAGPRVSHRDCLRPSQRHPGQMLPQELGCGSGMTCWRRLRDWQKASIWNLMHFAMLDWLARHGQIE